MQYLTFDELKFVFQILATIFICVSIFAVIYPEEW